MADECPRCGDEVGYVVKHLIEDCPEAEDLREVDPEYRYLT